MHVVQTVMEGKEGLGFFTHIPKLACDGLDA